MHVTYDSGEILRTGMFLEVVLSVRTLLLFAFALVLFFRLRVERRQARMFWQVQCSLNKRNRKLCSVWYVMNCDCCADI